MTKAHWFKRLGAEMMKAHWRSTNAFDLPKATVRYDTNRTLYVIPRGRVGEEDGKGYRKVVWQRSEKKIYVVCPGCGGIVHYPISQSFIVGEDIYTHACIACRLCSSHTFALLKGAGRAFSRLIKKDPRTCPCCRKADDVHSCNWQYEILEGNLSRLYSVVVFYCVNCGSVCWEDPKGEPKLDREIRY